MVETESSYGFQRMRNAPEDEYPLAEVSLGLLLHVKTHVPLPEAAMVRLALRELRRMAGEIEARQLKPTTSNRAPDREPKTTSKPSVLLPVEPPVAFAGLDKRVVNTAFRILDLVAKDESEGREALVSDLTEEVSAPTLARFMDASTPAGASVAAWFRIEKRGRTRAILLTETGRRAAGTRKPLVTLVAKA